jgi:maleate isomerase
MQRDYGSQARIGILPPQANPTVEPEIGLLLPSGVSMLVNRLVSQGEPRQRFLDYFRNLETTLQGFDTMDLDVAGFACTASSYLLDEGEEERSCAALHQQFGYPVITAATAIRQALQFLGAKRIALGCPYPAWLLEHAETFWSRQGLDIVASFSAQPRMGDTRAIYKVTAAEATLLIGDAFAGVNCDAMVITGTGVPALQVICDLQEKFGVPVFNSNLALAWACLRATRASLDDRAPEAGFPLLGGWQDQIHRL